MSADFHIHVCKNKKEEKIAEMYVEHTVSRYDGRKVSFGYNILKVNGRWIDEKNWDGTGDVEQMEYIVIEELTKELRDKIELETHNVRVGEVSWLKADLFNDTNTYIPNTILRINKLIPPYKLTEITDDLILEVKKAFDLPNNTIKEKGVWDGEGYFVSEATPVIEFLEKYKGKKAFTISW